MAKPFFAAITTLVLVAATPAAPPSADRVLAKADVPKFAGDAEVAMQRTMNGLVLPIPVIGFVKVPVAIWECQVWHTPPFAAAGAARVRVTTRLLTIAD